ncbi:MogA/MoaB family molybdenum cofactor biosynthesis protein [Thermasporomyces composti]|uniref:Molybdenum cofactor synthesis domain-containing protein n=1 Tax=Thermasporomyces composti TaxID=696763 RepID=A0A3D9V2N9_THECX|nr:molybdenum cofactor synthesis domain-containing protein [Thermasporomyces composti]
MRAYVLTVSNRAAQGVYPDRAGPILVDGLRALGFAVDGPEVVPDGEPVLAALREAVAAAYDVVLTTGGTGLSPTDQTPEMTRRLVDVEIPGIAEMIRAYGVSKGIPGAALSRGVAGLAGSTIIINLPGSVGAARDGIAVLGPVLHHAVEQVHGVDHPSSGDHAGDPPREGAQPSGPGGGQHGAGTPSAGDGGGDAPGTGVGGAS